MADDEYITVTFTRFGEQNRGMFAVKADIKTIPLKVVIDALREIADKIESEMIMYPRRN